MKVLMLGWEFPPVVSGGLGVACYGLAKSLTASGVDVLFVLPKPLTNAERERTHTQIRQVPVAILPQNSTPENPQHTDALRPPTTHVAPIAPPPPSIRMETHRYSEWTPIDHPGNERRETVGITEHVPHVLQRVTFVTVDSPLQPYMTPDQYQHMVVENYVQHTPVTRWEERTVGNSGRTEWVEKIVEEQVAVDNPRDTFPALTDARSNQRPRPYIDEPRNEGNPTNGHLQESAQKGSSSNNNHESPNAYAGDLFSETARYAKLVLSIAAVEKFDVIHAHDWMTFEAGMAVAQQTGKPLVVQIHSSEVDRAGSNGNMRILEAERAGMLAAAKIVAVSERTRDQLVERYGIDREKIIVVYNATDATPANESTAKPATKKKSADRVVLFLGRMVEQKGPDYFLKAAAKVAGIEKDVKFVMAGDGDMVPTLKKLAIQLKITRKVHFAGFVKKPDAERVFRSADVYVMPSVSEPFGIAPLEALSHDIPVIISKQSGVSEVLQHVLKVDFWDTDELANKIVSLLRHPPLSATLREGARTETHALSWDNSAERVKTLYTLVTRKTPNPKRKPVKNS